MVTHLFRVDSDPNEFNIVICASGGGGNFQKIVDAQEELGIKISHLIVDRQCGAINRAFKARIAHSILDFSQDGDRLIREFLDAIPKNTNLIVLAGFMPILPDEICYLWSGKIINTHPSLLPKFGGKGMYGVKVQEAVLAAGEKFAGCTVHFVTPEIDGGEIILQKSISVHPNETAWQLGQRVFNEENQLLLDSIKLLKSNFKIG